jgi:hypothetical protein
MVSGESAGFFFAFVCFALHEKKDTPCAHGIAT